MDTVFSDIGIVVVCSVALAWLSILARQPIIVAYILAGVLVGPWGFKLVHDVHFVDSLSRLGVTLLLFLAGIVLHPRRLAELLKQTLVVTLISSVVFCTAVTGFLSLFGFSLRDSLLAGLALMFSSTILVVKLLPTTALHQKRMGSLCIAILIAQDLIAVILLMFINSRRPDSAVHFGLLPLLGIALIAAVLAFEQFVLRRIMRQVEYFHELLYLLALAYCFGVALLAERIGFSREIGAFLAGVALARNPISFFLSEGLKFFRDFFLVLFFFVLGARLNLFTAREVLVPALLLAVALVAVKTLVFRRLFSAHGEAAEFSREMSVRLSQASEFSFIFALLALEVKVMSESASQLVQIVTIVTMVISSYLTVSRFPTPLGVKKQLKMD